MKKRKVVKTRDGVPRGAQVGDQGAGADVPGVPLPAADRVGVCGRADLQIRRPPGEEACDPRKHNGEWPYSVKNVRSLHVRSIQSEAAGCGKGFVTCFLRVPQAVGLKYR